MEDTKFKELKEDYVDYGLYLLLEEYQRALKINQELNEEIQELKAKYGLLDTYFDGETKD